MSEARLTNLDIRCAELGQKIASIKEMEEKVINDSLAVLEEQGPYAMFLYLRAQHNKVAGSMEQHSLDLLKEVLADKVARADDILAAIKHLADDLDSLLFARDLLQTALSYARYHLKAKGEDNR